MLSLAWITKMPIFEYICRDCSHRFEWLVRRASVPHCPECDSEVLERQLSVFAVSTGAATPVSARPCGTCGDPRGPGACSLS